MSNLQNLRDIGLVLGGMLVGACLFSVPKQASSAYRAGDTVMGAIIIEKDKRDRWERQPNNPEGWGGITRSSSYYWPMRVSAPTDGREITLHADLAPFEHYRFFARGHYSDERRAWVVKRELIGQDGFELLNVNARGWLPC